MPSSPPPVQLYLRSTLAVLALKSSSPRSSVPKASPFFTASSAQTKKVEQAATERAVKEAATAATAAKAAKAAKETEARRKQEERRARKETKEAGTAAILVIRRAAKELVKKSRNRKESPSLASQFDVRSSQKGQAGSEET